MQKNFIYIHIDNGGINLVQCHISEANNNYNIKIK